MEMLQVWGGLEEQLGEDNWHNAGCTNNNMRCVSRLEIFNSIYSTRQVVLGRTLEHAKTAAIQAGLDKPT